MIPGRNVCYNGWNLEYNGYLVAVYFDRPTATEYICLDDRPDVEVGRVKHKKDDGTLLFIAINMPQVPG